MSISKTQIVETAMFTLEFAKQIFADIADERMTEQPSPTMNHPAWVIGHLAVAANGAARFLGGENKMPDEWNQKFGIGSKLTAARADYPSKADLIAALVDNMVRATELFAKADDAYLAAEIDEPRRRERFGTNGRFLTFLLTSHVAFHAGQVSTWRRAVGMGSAL